MSAAVSNQWSVVHVEYQDAGRAVEIYNTICQSIRLSAVARYDKTIKTFEGATYKRDARRNERTSGRSR